MCEGTTWEDSGDPPTVLTFGGGTEVTITMPDGEVRRCDAADVAMEMRFDHHARLLELSERVAHLERVVLGEE